MSSMKRTVGRGGRPSKGRRHAFHSRVPEPLAALVMDAADDSDLSYSDYITIVLAEKHGYVLPPDFPRLSEQQKRDVQGDLLEEVTTQEGLAMRNAS